MKRLILVILCVLLSLSLLAGSGAFLTPTKGQSSSTAFRFLTGSSLPATCRVGDVFYKTGSSSGQYNCSATNTWTSVSESGSVTGTGTSGRLAKFTDVSVVGDSLLNETGGNIVLTSGLFNFGGSTSSFPALKRNSASLQARLADDSADAAILASNLTLSGLTANSFLYSGTAGLLTTTTAPTNGQLLIGSTGAAPVKATLTEGSGISITNGAGSITIASSGDSGSSAWMVPAYQYPFGTNSQASNGVNDRVVVFRFRVERKITITQINFEIASSTAGSSAAVGVYSADGNTKLADTGAISSASTGQKIATFSAVALNPGFYWLAFTCTHSTVNFRVVNATANVSDILNQGTAQIGRAANASALGVLPATLGAITGSTSDPIIQAKLQG